MTTITPSSFSGAERLGPRSAGGTIELTTALRQVAAGLGIGTRVEVTLVRQADTSLVRLQVRPLEGAMAGATIDQLQPAASIPARLIAAAPTVGTAAPGNSARLSGEVVALQPTLVLRLAADGAATDAPPTNQPPTGPAAWFQAQLRQHLPRSLPLASTFDSWRRPSPDQGTSLPGVSAPTAETPHWTRLTARLVGDLLARLPGTADLTHPDRLRHAVRQSGLWLEAALARQALDPVQHLAPHGDLKAQLTRLAERIRTLQRADATTAETARRNLELGNGTREATPGTASRATVAAGPAISTPSADAADATSRASGGPATDDGQGHESGPPARAGDTLEPGRASPHRADPAQAEHDEQTARGLRTLDRQVAGALDKIVTNQLLTLDAGPDQPRWLLELPFRTPSGVAELEAEIERERHSAPAEDESWHLRLRLNLPRLGPLSIRLTLRADRLSAGLNAASPESGELLSRNLPALRERLNAKEIEVASLHAGCRPETHPAPRAGSGSLNERA